ncbi:MAG: YcgL domain-containing protein [bacterium]
MKRLCTIYKSPKKEQMYLYVDMKEDLSRVPEPLLDRFGTPQKVTSLALSDDRKLARANAEKVLKEIDEKGFYLQMPPTPEQYMQDLVQKNDKL